MLEPAVQALCERELGKNQSPKWGGTHVIPMVSLESLGVFDLCRKALEQNTEVTCLSAMGMKDEPVILTKTYQRD